MSHSFFDRKEVSTGFIEMKSESMPQGVQVEAVTGQSACLQLMDKDVVDRLLTDVTLCLLSGEEPVFRLCAAVRVPDIGDEQIISLIGQDGIPVGTVLAAGDIDTVFGTEDIPAVQAAELTDTDPGRIQKSDLSLVFRIRDGVNESDHLLPGRDSRKELVEMQEGDFPLIPVFVKDVVEEIAEL